MPSLLTKYHTMLDKLKSHSIGGKIWRLINDWLSNRKQRVYIRGCRSWKPVYSRVPQVSVLGQILFLTFTNDIDLGIINWILKFSDDTKVFGKVNDATDRNHLQQDIKACGLVRGGRCSLTYLNASRWAGRILLQNKLHIYMNNQELEQADQEKGLVVLVIYITSSHHSGFCKVRAKPTGLLD